MKPKEIMTPLQSAQAYLLDVEHKLADAHDRIRLLIAERNTARLQADQRVSLREEFRELLGTDEIEQGVVVVRGLQDRIKRLEEAGDALDARLGCGCMYCGPCRVCQSASENWDEAKEAKP
jgi:hypothetical protein